MAVSQTVHSHPSAIEAYIRHGWSLVPIPNGTKGPRTVGWNKRENALKSQSSLPPGWGIGLAHAYSGTMALDIDDWDTAALVLSQKGIDLRSLYDAPDAVVIDSGRKGRGKLIYAMPFGATLPSKKIIINGVVVYELRCATADGSTVQDVLPPSIHPETQQPYRWAGRGNWSRLPTIPHPLFSVWHELVTSDKDRILQFDQTCASANWEEVNGALAAISPSCSRDEWVQIGMALHWAGNKTDQLDQAFHTWNDWSSQSEDKYPGQKEMATQWLSFNSNKPSTVKLPSLFHIARKYGWVRPSIDASALFAQTADVTPPLKLTSGLRPKPPEMLIDLWPDVLKKRAREVSDSVGCDVIIPLFAGLSAVCGVVDARIRLELMPGFRVPPVLWLMTLGEPADKKTPGSKPMLSPLKAIEAEDVQRYAKAVLEWEGKEAAYSAAKKSFLEWSASPDGLMSGGDGAPHVPDMPPAPVPVKITVNDVTSQKLVRMGADRPRGLLCYLDEMNSWVKKVVDKTSSEDRSTWVVSYESDSYEMDRVGAGSIHCENLAVSIYGNIQPQVFRQNLASLAADGLIQRFIPAVLRADSTRLGTPIADELTSAAQWEGLLRMVYAIPVQTYRLSRDAYDAYRVFQSWYEQAKQDERLLDPGSEYMTAFGKLEGLVGRICLLFHVMESPFNPQVSVDVVERVIDLVKGYVIPAYRYSLSEIGGVMSNAIDRWIVDHIIQISGEATTVTLSDIRTSARRQLEGKTDAQKDQMIEDAMGNLEKAEWVTRIEADPFKRKVTWAINQQLPIQFSDYRLRVLKAKQRHADYIYRHAYKQGRDRKVVKGYDPSTMDE